MIKAQPKPLEWEEDSATNGYREWYDNRYGFHIEFHGGNEVVEDLYEASWGENDTESFATLEEAQAWCFDQVQYWVTANVILVDDKPIPPTERTVHETGM